MYFQQQKYFRPYNHIVPKKNSPIKYSHNKESPYYQSQQQQYPVFEKTTNIKQHLRPGRQIQQPIWDHLYHNGLRSQKQLLQKHENNKNKIDIECTFTPIVKQNKRYLVQSSSTFLQRVNVWQQHKIQKMVRQKQEQVNRDLKQCTFKPKINKNIKYYEEPVTKSKNISRSPLQNRNLNPYYSPIKVTNTKKQIISPPQQKKQKVELSMAKQMIRSQLKRLAL